MNFFQSLYFTFATQPQLNLLHFFYQLTGDIGWAIILISICINGTMWPLFANSYFNLQKTKLYQPKLKEIRDLYKDKPQEMLKANNEFYKKHNISNKATFYILIIQLFFVSGIYFIIRDISQGKQINGLYQAIFNQEVASFNPSAFGVINVGASATNYLWMVVLISVLSFIYGFYTLKLAPKTITISAETQAQKDEKIAKMSATEKEKFELSKSQEKALQSSSEFLTLYFSPGLFFFIGLSSPTGVNFYILTTTILSILRQIFVTNYYKEHTNALIEKIMKTDPVSNTDLKIKEDDEFIEPNLNQAIANKIVPTSQTLQEIKKLNTKSSKSKVLSAKQKSILKKKAK